VTVDPAEKEELLARFSDQDQVSDWAQNSAAACIKIGIIRGNPDGTFAPLADTTRAASAAMISRLLDAAKLI